MSVGEFDPTSIDEDLSEELIHGLCALVKDNKVDLSSAEQQRYSTLVKHKDWAKKATTLESATLETLICLFTLGESQYPQWIAEDKSPVILFVRELKNRGQFKKETGRWIKENTSNKFLPHGSLMDLL